MPDRGGLRAGRAQRENGPARRHRGPHPPERPTSRRPQHRCRARRVPREQGRCAADAPPRASPRGRARGPPRVGRGRPPRLQQRRLRRSEQARRSAHRRGFQRLWLGGKPLSRRGPRLRSVRTGRTGRTGRIHITSDHKRRSRHVAGTATGPGAPGAVVAHPGRGDPSRDERPGPRRGHRPPHPDAPGPHRWHRRPARRATASSRGMAPAPHPSGRRGPPRACPIRHGSRPHAVDRPDHRPSGHPPRPWSRTRGRLRLGCRLRARGGRPVHRPGGHGGQPGAGSGPRQAARFPRPTREDGGRSQP
jgi:hypothetical protein